MGKFGLVGDGKGMGKGWERGEAGWGVKTPPRKKPTIASAKRASDSSPLAVDAQNCATHEEIKRDGSAAPVVAWMSSARSGMTLMYASLTTRTPARRRKLWGEVGELSCALLLFGVWGVWVGGEGASERW